MDPKKKSVIKEQPYMKKAIVFVLSAIILVLSSCQKKAPQEQQSNQNATVSTGNTVSVVRLSKSDQADTLHVFLKILDPNGKKVFYNTLDNSNFLVKENGSIDPNIVPKVNSVKDIRDKRVISDQLSMLFLIDRSESIPQEALQKQYKLIYDILNSDTKAKVYLSFMDDALTPSKLATKNHFYDDFLQEFEVQKGTQKYLYKAVMAKMEELSASPAVHYPEISHNEDLRDSTQKILFVLTDGKVNNEDGTSIGGSQ